MPLADDVRIAGKLTVKDWRDRKTELQSNGTTQDWKSAYSDFYMGRLSSRYFGPIKSIETNRSDEGEGFAIVAIYCTLIEFLEATYQGRKYVYRAAETDKIYSQSGSVFKRFLRDRPPFAALFANDDETADFYDSVRNGLLHEARTRNGWLIRVDSSATEPILPSRKTIFRNRLRSAFQTYFEWYQGELSTKSKVQEAFIDKFDSLCE